MLREGVSGLLLLLTGVIAFEEIHYSKDGFCPQLAHISLGRVNPSSLSYQRAVEGAVAEYSCAPGYEIEGSVNRTCVNTIHGLSWTSDKPRCIARRCPAITDFANGYVFEGTRFPGSSTVFTCYPSHVLVGARFVRCQQNWTWDAATPTCVRACPLTPPLDNGHYNQTFAPIGQSVEVICDRCHNSTNGHFLKCGADGEFEQPDPVCDPMLCPTPFGQALPSTVIVEYMCDSIAKFDCPGGQTVLGATNVTCLENGTWSDNLPTCGAPSQSDLQIEVIELTNRSGQFYYGWNDGNGITTICLPREASLPDLVDGCFLPDNVPNGDYMMKLPGHRIGESFTVDGNDDEKRYDLDVLLGPLVPGYERKVPEGSITLYTCNHGYHLEGNRRTVCAAGEWIGDLPECIAITCDPPDEDATGFGYYVVEGNRVGDTASFRCYDGYYSNELPHVVTCNAEGTWTGGKHPTCSKISCGGPPIYDDVELVGGGDFQSDLTLRCHDEEENVTTNFEITCQANGQWDLSSAFSCSLGGNLAICPTALDCNKISYAALGILLSQNSAYLEVSIQTVLFPSSIQPDIQTIRQFIIPTSMRCCKRLIVGDSYLFTGRFFGSFMFTNGCRDIYYYRYDNQAQLLYSRSHATLAKQYPFCPHKL